MFVGAWPRRHSEECEPGRAGLPQGASGRRVRDPLLRPWSIHSRGRASSGGSSPEGARGESSAPAGPWRGGLQGPGCCLAAPGSRGVRSPSVPQRFTFLRHLRLCRGPAGGGDPPTLRGGWSGGRVPATGGLVAVPAVSRSPQEVGAQAAARSQQRGACRRPLPTPVGVGRKDGLRSVGLSPHWEAGR